MSTDFVVVSENNPQSFQHVSFKGAAVKYSFDFSPWADANATVTSVTWTVKAGSAVVSGAALASNVATALVTFGEAGGNMIQLKAETASNGIYIAYLDVLAKDWTSVATDYGIVV